MSGHSAAMVLAMWDKGITGFSELWFPQCREILENGNMTYVSSRTCSRKGDDFNAKFNQITIGLTDVLGENAKQVIYCLSPKRRIWFSHDDVIKWTYFSRYGPFEWGIHRSHVNSPHKGQWRVALMFSLICIWIKGWVNNREAGDLRSIAPIMTSL